MKVPGSSRSVFIISAEGTVATIEVSQPSDCLLLQRENVQRSCLERVTVWLGYINGPPEPQSPDTWKEALHHILDTYRPAWCNLHIKDSQTGIQDGYQVEMTDGTSYTGHWNESKNLLIIAR